MIILKKSWWIAAAALIGFSSCTGSDSSSYTSSALGVVQRNPQNSNQWWFMSDDSVTFAPATVREMPRKIHRAIAYMEHNSNIRQLDGYTYTVDFMGFDTIPVYPIISTGADYLNDSAPNDHVHIQRQFVSLQYLNIAALFSGSDDSKHNHKFFLLRDSLISSPVRLLFRHSLGGDDSNDQPLETNLSFDLETLAERSAQDSVHLRLMLSENNFFDFTYKFRK